MKMHRKLFAAFTAAMLAVSSSGISAAATTPPAYFHHSYESAEEMQAALQTTFTPGLIESIEEQYYSENADGFEKSLALWRENGIPEPYFKGEPMGNGLDGGKALNFYISDLFELPALYYHPAIEEWSYITVQYLEDEQAALAQEMGISALMNELNPHPENDVEYPTYYDREEMVLNVNGKDTDAIVGRELCDERTFYHFVYDNLLIKAACVVNPSEDPDDFFRWLSFEKVTEELASSDEVIEEKQQNGDVNGNGEVDILDVVILNRALLGAEKLTKAAEKLVDVDGDGKSTAADSLLIMKYLVKLVPSLDAEALAPAARATAEIRIDKTMAVSDAGWDAVRSDAASYVIQSGEQLETELQPLFGNAVTRSLQKTYDAKFFEENVLLFKILPLSGSEDVNVAEEDVTIENGTLNVCYTYSETKMDVYGAALVQVAVPRDVYSEEKVVWAEKDAQPVGITLETESVYTINTNRVWDKAMIRSTEELKDFLGQSLTEEGVAMYAEKYPAEFFEENTLYMELAWGHAPGYTCEGVAMKTGEEITVNAWKTKSYGCVEQILHTAVLDKKDADGAEVVLRKLNDDEEEMHGEYSMYSSPDGYHPGVYVNAYSFHDEYELEFGWLLEGSDCMYLADKVTSVPMEDGYMPFAGAYEPSEDEEGNECCVGESFEIHWMYEEIVIKYKTAENSTEMETLKLNYPWN